MAQPTLSIKERSFIVSQYNETQNYAEVKRRFSAEYGRSGPDGKTTRRLVEKFKNFGSVENSKPKGNPKTHATNANGQVRLLTFTVGLPDL